MHHARQQNILMNIFSSLTYQNTNLNTSVNESTQDIMEIENV
jgi:hypothetical protein